ncbi:hypothetical protein [Actinomarinicola tropica]|uniref:hypothetical protein n=1 Tax=Actinomarinicola tropica TaxID=2789776 RepID=UPI001E50A80C|nr:hypothetical protein [Actinomarinicola tropica]
MTNLPTLITSAPERAQHLVDLTVDTAQTAASRVERSAGAVVTELRERVDAGRERLLVDVERARATLDARVRPHTPASRAEVAALEARLAEVEARAARATRSSTAKSTRAKKTTTSSRTTKD